MATIEKHTTCTLSHSVSPSPEVVIEAVFMLQVEAQEAYRLAKILHLLTSAPTQCCFSHAEVCGWPCRGPASNGYLACVLTRQDRDPCQSMTGNIVLKDCFV